MMRFFSLSLLFFFCSLFCQSLGQDSSSSEARSLVRSLHPIKTEVLSLTISQPIEKSQAKRLERKLKSLRKKFESQKSLVASDFGTHFSKVLEDTSSLLDVKVEYLETVELAKNQVGHERRLSQLKNAIISSRDSLEQHFQHAKDLSEGLSINNPGTPEAEPKDVPFLAAWVLPVLFWVGFFWSLFSGSVGNTRSSRGWARLFTGRSGSTKSAREFTKDGEPVAYWLTILGYFMMAVVCTVCCFLFA